MRFRNRRKGRRSLFRDRSRGGLDLAKNVGGRKKPLASQLESEYWIGWVGVAS